MDISIHRISGFEIVTSRKDRDTCWLELRIENDSKERIEISFFMSQSNWPPSGIHPILAILEGACRTARQIGEPEPSPIDTEGSVA